MSPYAAQILKFLVEQKELCAIEVMRLVAEDAPKNKFSIITGKYKAFEILELEIKALEDQSAASR